MAEAQKPDPAAKPHYHGHRQRLRQRFLDSGEAALPDYELLELLLFLSKPRGDVKPLAKTLLDRFGSFAEVLSASAEELRAVEGIGDTSLVALKSVQAAAIRLAREQAMRRPIIASWQQLIDYCRVTMAHNRTEEFRVLFLDRKNRLIKDEVQQRGTIDHTPVYPREVVKRALELHACALIMVHNHPSGDPTPSRADIDMTRQVASAGKAVGVLLHDHLIIARGGHNSLKAMGYL